MLRDSDTGFAKSLQDPLDFRIQTLQEVLTGEMNPLERRVEIVRHRPGIVFGRTKISLGSSPLKESSIEEFEQEGSRLEIADSVKIELESPSEDELRVANFLDEKYPQAKSIALSSEDTIEVPEAPGGTFRVDVSEVLQREFGEDPGTQNMDSSVPSMTTAADQRFNS
jgi:hypothetical protein